MKITTYKKAVTYLEGFIRPSIFKSITPQEAEKMNPLLRMEKLLEFLGNPHKKFKSVQVTGTSGKGSTSYLISKILTQAGYKTGLTISPHIQKANERIQINNIQIKDKDFIEIINKFPKIVVQMVSAGFEEPTYYELLLSIAFLYFAQEKIDIAVVEVGLEGKYDATNLVDAPVVVLTNIGLDHTEILGDTVEKIANEAVFAIGKNAVVVTGEKNPKVLKIIGGRCQETNSKLLQIDKDFSFKINKENSEGINFNFNLQGRTLLALNFNLQGRTLLALKNIDLSLVGDYQAKNATLAISAVLNLEKIGFKVSEKDIKEALSSAFFPGRFEIINLGAEVASENFRVHSAGKLGLKSKKSEGANAHSENFEISPRSLKLILDGAHNVDKMKAFLSSLNKYFPKEKKIFLVAFKKDKNIKEMIKQIQKYAEKIIFSEFLAVTDMSKSASYQISNIKYKISNKPETYYEKDSKKALGVSLKLAQNIPDSIIVVTGSLYFVGEIRSLLAGRGT
ncbi:MAG: Mur ligase family protein [Patescibacteria group bacterium]